MFVLSPFIAVYFYCFDYVYCSSKNSCQNVHNIGDYISLVRYHVRSFIRMKLQVFRNLNYYTNLSKYNVLYYDIVLMYLSA